MKDLFGEHLSTSESDTVALARRLTAALPTRVLITLSGPLGSGKSVFARGLIRALADDPALEVPSPTFTLVQHYEGPKGPIAHFDLYRLENPEEIYELGLEDALAESIALIEWPERAGNLLPSSRIEIVFSTACGQAEARKIIIGSRGIL